MKAVVKWGVTLNVVLIVWMLCEELFGLHDTYIHLQAYLTLLANVPFIFIYRYALSKRLQEKSMTRKELIVHGTGIALVAALISPISQYLIAEVVSPSYFTNAIEYAVKSGSSTRAQASAFFTLRSYIPQLMIGTFLSGIIFSILVSYMIIKKQQSNKSSP